MARAMVTTLLVAILVVVGSAIIPRLLRLQQRLTSMCTWPKWPSRTKPPPEPPKGWRAWVPLLGGKQQSPQARPVRLPPRRLALTHRPTCAASQQQRSSPRLSSLSKGSPSSPRSSSFSALGSALRLRSSKDLEGAAAVSSRSSSSLGLGRAWLRARQRTKEPASPPSAARLGFVRRWFSSSRMQEASPADGRRQREQDLAAASTSWLSWRRRSS